MLDGDDLQRLARQIASGELRGSAALLAVAKLIAAKEIPPAATPRERQLIHAEIVATLRGDEDLLRAVAHAEAPWPAAASSQPRGVASKSGSKHPRVTVSTELFGRAASSRSAGSLPIARDAGDDAPEIAGRSSRMLVVGVALGAVVLVAGVYAVSRSGPCDALARRICLESGQDDCSIAGLQVALREHAVNATVCEVASESLDAALERATAEGRDGVLRETLSKALGFDVLPGDPEPSGPAPVARHATLELVRDQMSMQTLLADEAFLYWSRVSPPGVFRVRSIGGAVERLGGAQPLADLAVSDHAVYWREAGADGPSLWADPKRGVYEPEAIPLAESEPAIAAFLGPEVIYAEAKTGAIMIAPVAGGAAPRQVVPGTGVVPSHLLGDETHVYWAEPPPTSRIFAVARAGGAAAELGTASAGVRRLKIGGEGLWLVDGAGALHLWERRACDSAACTTLGARRTIVGNRSPVADVVSDAGTVYWSEPEAGLVVAKPLGGGPVVTIAQGLERPTCLGIDGAAVYWEAAGTVSRWAK